MNKEELIKKWSEEYKNKTKGKELSKVAIEILLRKYENNKNDANIYLQWIINNENAREANIKIIMDDDAR